jgi:hypothetical protein
MVAEASHGSGGVFGEALDLARDHSYAVPEQARVGRKADVGLDDRSIDAEALTILHARLHRAPDDLLVDLADGIGGEPVEGTVEGVMTRNGLRVESSEHAPADAVRDPLTERVRIPAHRDH